MKALVAFLIIFEVHVLNAQVIIHIDYDKHTPKKDGFSGNLDLSMSLNQAVNFVFGTNNASQCFFKKEKHTVKSLNGLNLTVVNDSKPINDGFQHVRYSYALSDRFFPEAFIQGQYNHNIKIRSRYIFGVGALYKVWNKETDSVQLHVGIHYMPENEEELTGLINNHQRLNTMLSWGYTFKSKLKLDVVSYFQPDLLRLNDFRFLLNSAAEMPITERLTFRSSLGIVFDTHPPADLRQVFFNTRNGLRYTF